MGGGWWGLGWVVRLRVSEAFGFCIWDALKNNKYGTRTGVAELMCEQLGGDCSRKRLYIVCIIFKLGSVLVCILEFSVRKHCYKLCLGMMGDSPKYGG